MKLLADLPRNSRNCILIEPMWSIFGGMIIFYAPIYMKSMGITEIEMGIINTVNMLVAFIFHFLAAPITNRLGRKKATLYFDLLSWSIPMLIWAVAQNFWYFLAAYIINATVRVVAVSWYCLLMEDAPDNKRVRILAIINIINYATGMFTPVTGLLIAKFGTVPTLRVLYGAGMLSMTAMFIIRNFLVAETKAGTEILHKQSSMSIFQSFGSYLGNIAGILKNRRLVIISVIFVVTNFIISMNYFQVLFLRDNLGFNEKLISLIPFVGAAINLLLYIFVLPRMSWLGDEKILAFSMLISCFGFVLLLLVPKGNLLFMLSSVAVMAVGNFLMISHRDAVFINSIGEHEKADVYAAVQTLTTLICVPSGFLGGLLFSYKPSLPFVIISVLFLTGFLISLLLLKHERERMKANA